MTGQNSFESWVILDSGVVSSFDSKRNKLYDVCVATWDNEKQAESFGKRYVGTEYQGLKVIGSYVL